MEFCWGHDEQNGAEEEWKWIWVSDSWESVEYATDQVMAGASEKLCQLPFDTSSPVYEFLIRS